MKGGATSTRMASVDIQVRPQMWKRDRKKASGTPRRQAPMVPRTPTNSVFFRPFR